MERKQEIALEKVDIVDRVEFVVVAEFVVEVVVEFVVEFVEIVEIAAVVRQRRSGCPDNNDQPAALTAAECC